MDIRVIDNRGPNTVQRALKQALHHARETAIAVPFVDLPGLRLLRPDLERVARNGPVRLIVGISPEAFNDPEALQLLSAIAESYQNRFQVRISKLGGDFHQKLYLTKSRSRSHAIVGSANLTRKGLTRPSEVAIDFCGPSGTSPIRDLWSGYEDVFRVESIPLSDSLLSAYRLHANLVHANLPKSGATGHWARLRAYLGRRSLGESSQARETWFDLIEGELPKAVESKIEEQTNWKNPYYSCRSKRLHDRISAGDILLLKEQANGRHFLSINRVTDKAKVRTSWGSYFLEYQQQGRKKSWNLKLEQAIRSAGIPIPSKAGPAIALTSPQWNAFKTLVILGQKRHAPSVRYSQGFLTRIGKCAPQARVAALQLHQRINEMGRDVEYYPTKRDLRYTDRRVPKKQSGDREPFLHIFPRKNSLIVHVDEDVVVPRGIRYVYWRTAASRFLRWFHVRSVDDLDRDRMSLIRQSFRIFLRRHRL